MEDLKAQVEALRSAVQAHRESDRVRDAVAADRERMISKLVRRNELLRAALTRIQNDDYPEDLTSDRPNEMAWQATARQALERTSSTWRPRVPRRYGVDQQLYMADRLVGGVMKYDDGDVFHAFAITPKGGKRTSPLNSLQEAVRWCEEQSGAS